MSKQTHFSEVTLSLQGSELRQLGEYKDRKEKVENNT